MVNSTRDIIITDEAAGQRIDAYLADNLEELSRSRIQSMLKDGDILINDAPVKANYRLLGGEQVKIVLRDSVPLVAAAEDISLDIVYEDKDIIVINKKQGMVVHPAAGHEKGTLVNALLHHCGDLSGINGVIRPGIVHRIDKDTSGLLVAAKNDAAHLGLSEQWKEHDIKRIYHALLEGSIGETSGIIDAPIGRHPKDRKKMAVEPKNGRNAITRYLVLERFPEYSYVELQLETGRTHQIRVHMSHLGHPVVGDMVYGRRKQKLAVPGQVLHAKVLGFKHPITGEYLEFNSDLPPYFLDLLTKLRRGEI